MRKPPQHALDATPVYVLHTDPAWDNDRIERELEADPEGQHPQVAYYSGATRFDLHAPAQWAGEETSAAEYLTGRAARFELRRLTVHKIAEIRDDIRRAINRDGAGAGLAAVFTKCAKHGLAGISDGVEFDSRAGVVTDATLGQIYDEHGPDAIEAIGAAVWRLSQPLSDAEKRP